MVSKTRITVIIAITTVILATVAILIWWFFRNEEDEEDEGEDGDGDGDGEEDFSIVGYSAGNVDYILQTGSVVDSNDDGSLMATLVPKDTIDFRRETYSESESRWDLTASTLRIDQNGIEKELDIYMKTNGSAFLFLFPKDEAVDLVLYTQVRFQNILNTENYLLTYESAIDANSSENIPIYFITDIENQFNFYGVTNGYGGTLIVSEGLSIDGTGTTLEVIN